MTMVRTSSIALLLFAATVTPLSVPSTHVVHEERDASHQSTWLKKDRVPQHVNLSVRIGLKQSNLENAEKYLMDVSDLDSPNYAKYWTNEEVVEKFKPSDDTITTVRNWLVDAGIDNKSIVHTDNKAWFAFHATAKKMESLLHTEYHEFEYTPTGGIVPACDRYHVPERIQKHVDYITSGVNLIVPSSKQHHRRTVEQSERPSERHGPLEERQSSPGDPDLSELRPLLPENLNTCDQVTTPACIAALYKIPRGHLAHSSNSMGILSNGQNLWHQGDLDYFFSEFADHIPSGTHPNDVNTEGGDAKSVALPIKGDLGQELALDLDMAYPIVYPQTIAIWDFNDFYCPLGTKDIYSDEENDLLNSLDGSYCSSFKPTNVISVSLGWAEESLSVALRQRLCNGFMKWGLRGTSVVVASGDHGVSWQGACFGSQQDIFVPTWPSSCPWVTSVSGTRLYPGQALSDPESAACVCTTPLIAPYSTGGGFGNHDLTPDYQKAAMSAFFAEHSPSYPSYSALPNTETSLVEITKEELGGVYNRNGRGYPDVSANGLNGVTIFEGNYITGGGTSMSTPLFAAIINRINEERLAAGKNTIGFLNPVLYKHPEVLNDITNGTNPGCGTEGFSAVKG